MRPVDLPVVEFADRVALRAWLVDHHATSSGVYVRIATARSGAGGVTFGDVLDEGLCFGWSESTRLPGDDASYLQRFTPRAKRGTTSRRNLEHAERLVEEGLMTDAGLAALGAPAGSNRSG